MDFFNASGEGFGPKNSIFFDFYSLLFLWLHFLIKLCSIFIEYLDFCKVRTLIFVRTARVLEDFREIDVFALFYFFLCFYSLFCSNGKPKIKEKQ